jgi:hypothetical protein
MKLNKDICMTAEQENTSKYKDRGTSIVDGVLSGATGPLGALFGDKHATSSYSFPLDVEGVGQRHFIRFQIKTYNGSTFQSLGKSSTSADSDAVGNLLGGAVGAAVGGGIGGGILGNIAGNAADSLGISDAVGNITDAAQDVAGTLVGGALSITDPLIGGLENVADDLLGGVVDFAGDLAGGAVDFAGNLAGEGLDAVGDLLSGDIPELPSLDDLGLPEIPSLADLNVPLPSLDDILDVESAWGSIEAAATETWGNLTSAVGDLQESLTGALSRTADALKSIGDEDPEDESAATDSTVQSISDILLYIPHNVTESYQAGWTSGAKGIAGTIQKSAEDSLSQGFSIDAMQNLFSDLKARAGGTDKLLREGLGKLASKAFSNPELEKAVLQESAGIAVDPQFILLFTGVQARTFTFDFKMSPRNASEAQMISRIVRIFKQYAAPSAQEADGYRMWELPALFHIEYWNVSQTHRIKPCALTGIAVNYTGSGTNHTFYDGYPIQTDLTLTFTESSLLTRQDFAEASGDDKGGY